MANMSYCRFDCPLIIDFEKKTVEIYNDWGGSNHAT